MTVINYRIQTWTRDGDWTLANSIFDSEKKHKLFFADKIEIFSDDDRHTPVVGINKVNSSSIDKNKQTNVYMLLRKTYKKKEKWKEVAEHIYSGLKKYCGTAMIEYYHHNDKYDLFLYTDNSIDSNYKRKYTYLVRKVMSLLSILKEDPTIRFQCQFMVFTDFKHPSDMKLDTLIDDAIQLMFPACHEDTPGVIIDFKKGEKPQDPISIKN